MQLKLASLTPEVIAGKRVLVRIDANVPLVSGPDGQQVGDDTRLRASLETINYLREHGAITILLSHLGRPSPQVREPELSLQVVADYYTQHLGVPVTFVENPRVVGDNVSEAVHQAQPGEVLLLQNTRYRQCERDNKPEFVRNLAKLGQVYVNDAFSVSHREHASVIGLADALPSYAGFALQREVEVLSKLMRNPAQPFVLMVGGAKISDKVAAIENLVALASIVLVGGAVANDFLKADGFAVHRSFIEEMPAQLHHEQVDYVQVARSILDEHRQETGLVDGHIRLPKIVYPLDVIAAPSGDPHEVSQHSIVNLTQDFAAKHHQANLQYLDIGPKTRELYAHVLSHAQTVFWNGPMGVWENADFSQGTNTVAHAAAQVPHSVIGGGDTIAAVASLDLIEDFEYVSLAGGATLKFLGGGTLPGLAALSQQNPNDL